MLSFKEYIFLERLDESFQQINKKMGMWKNPTMEEAEEIPPDVRAIGTAQGNLYVVNKKINFDSDNITLPGSHEFIIKKMHKLWGDTKKFKLGSDNGQMYKIIISLVKQGNRNIFYIGADEWEEIEGTEEKLHTQRKTVLKKVSKNSKPFSFKYLKTE